MVSPSSVLYSKMYKMQNPVAVAMQAKLVYQTSHTLVPLPSWQVCRGLVAPQGVLESLMLATAGDKPGPAVLRSDPAWLLFLRLK